MFDNKLTLPNEESLSDYLPMATIYKTRNPIIRFLYLKRFKMCLNAIKEEIANWILELVTGCGILLDSLSVLGKVII